MRSLLAARAHMIEYVCIHITHAHTTYWWCCESFVFPLNGRSRNPRGSSRFAPFLMHQAIEEHRVQEK